MQTSMLYISKHLIIEGPGLKNIKWPKAIGAYVIFTRKNRLFDFWRKKWKAYITICIKFSPNGEEWWSISPTMFMDGSCMHISAHIIYFISAISPTFLSSFSAIFHIWKSATYDWLLLLYSFQDIYCFVFKTINLLKTLFQSNSFCHLQLYLLYDKSYFRVKPIENFT